MTLRFVPVFLITWCGVLVFLFPEINLSGTSCTAEELQNHRPVVKILEPKNLSIHERGALVRYSISVSDKEDGESRFNEISSAKVFLQTLCVEGVPDSVIVKKFQVTEEPAGLTLMKKSDCFTCHQFKTRLIGPSMKEIAERYSEDREQWPRVVQRIREGSNGIWGEATMPAHPEVTAESARKIMDWILRTGSNPDVDYLGGTEGAIRVKVADNTGPGFFVLRASYLDQGLPGKPEEQLLGQDVVIVTYR
jgi:cytochrome c